MTETICEQGLHWEKKLQAIPVWLWVVIIFAGGIALRLGRLAELDYLERDEVFYLTLSETWAAEGAASVYSHENIYIPPLLISQCALLIRCGFSVEEAGKVIACLWGSLFIIPFFFIGRILVSSWRWGAFLAGVAAIHPYCARLSAVFLRDGLNVTLCAWILMWLLAALKYDKLPYWCCAGFWTALALYNRHESLEWLFLIPLLLLIHAYRSGWKIRRTLLALIAFGGMVGVGIILLGYLLLGTNNSFVDNYFRHGMLRQMLLWQSDQT